MMSETEGLLTSGSWGKCVYLSFMRIKASRCWFQDLGDLRSRFHHLQLHQVQAKTGK